MLNIAFAQLVFQVIQELINLLLAWIRHKHTFTSISFLSAKSVPVFGPKDILNVHISIGIWLPGEVMVRLGLPRKNVNVAN